MEQPLHDGRTEARPPTLDPATPLLEARAGQENPLNSSHLPAGMTAENTAASGLPATASRSDTRELLLRLGDIGFGMLAVGTAAVGVAVLALEATSMAGFVTGLTGLVTAMGGTLLIARTDKALTEL